MCGISGFCNFDQDYLMKKPLWEERLTNMRKTLSHRGNDSSGLYLSNHVGLSHARLSIRDLSNGTQPMVRTHQDRTCAIAYNGEIYNTDELIPELTRAGYAFESSSDTEVILYSYMHYGTDFVLRLNGIFSFAIWDAQKEMILLYRDRVGIKPHFYAVTEHTLLFASEPKALFAYPGFSPSITLKSLQEILAIGPARTPGCGVFQNVFEVLPGHYLTYNGEIYNTDELIPELTRAGYAFESSSDTEVILYSYMHYGTDFVLRLNGIFSFAIWDAQKEMILLYRDRVGIKPHFYAVTEHTLLFASEPKALFAYPGFSPSITLKSLQEILAIGPARTPGCGVFQNVFEVLPGHYLTFTKDGLKQHPYWDLTSVPHTDPYHDTVEKVTLCLRAEGTLCLPGLLSLYHAKEPAGDSRHRSGAHARLRCFPKRL